MAKKAPETNPFVQSASGFKITAIWKMEKLITAGAESSDSASAVSTQWRAYKFEKDDRVSLYIDGLLGFFPHLSSAAKDMMMYIAARMQYDTDIIELEEEKYCNVMNLSRSTFFSAKRELTNRIIIPRTSRRNTYWINPAYLFRGNRMEKYPDSVVMRNEHPFEKLDDKISAVE